MGTTDFSSYFQRIEDDKPHCSTSSCRAGRCRSAWPRATPSAAGRRRACSISAAASNERDLPAIGDAAIGDIVGRSLRRPPRQSRRTRRSAPPSPRSTAKPDDLPTFATVAAYDGMDLIFHMLKATGGKRDGDKMIAAAKGYSWESPRGPMTIDPKTREIDSELLRDQVEKVRRHADQQAGRHLQGRARPLARPAPADAEVSGHI